MGDLIGTLLQILINNPLTVTLVLLGVLCVVLAIIGKIPPIDIQGRRAVALGGLGGVLITLAVVLAWALAIVSLSDDQTLPAGITNPGETSPTSTSSQTGEQPTSIGSEIESTDTSPVSTPSQIGEQPAPAPPSSDGVLAGTEVYYCYGDCWQYDDDARTMTWTGPTDGIEDIWQPPGDALQNIRAGYTAIFTTSVPGEISACVLTVNETSVKNTCDGVLYQVAPGTYRVTSANGNVGGFRWCPVIGYGWRVNGGDCR
ncbi:MAG: hypothetical protein L0332_25445 [Chloroflexi bacterium]|nr:hypothetical protein [Chloroflexota bacterium]MCI0730043.1 hypothetical protein [Chloroflexota bacterium]